MLPALHLFVSLIYRRVCFLLSLSVWLLLKPTARQNASTHVRQRYHLKLRPVSLTSQLQPTCLRIKRCVLRQACQHDSNRKRPDRLHGLKPFSNLKLCLKRGICGLQDHYVVLLVDLRLFNDPKLCLRRKIRGFQDDLSCAAQSPGCVPTVRRIMQPPPAVRSEDGCSMFFGNGCIQPQKRHGETTLKNTNYTSLIILYLFTVSEYLTF
jgi:hypothetical protein